MTARTSSESSDKIGGLEEIGTLTWLECRAGFGTAVETCAQNQPDGQGYPFGGRKVAGKGGD